jgi:hypothetical protein
MQPTGVQIACKRASPQEHSDLAESTEIRRRRQPDTVRPQHNQPAGRSLLRRSMSLILFSVHLVLLGYLIYRLGYIPKIIGVLLAIDGLAWAINILQPYLYPHAQLGFLFPIFFFEWIFMLWLLIAGWKLKEPAVVVA